MWRSQKGLYMGGGRKLSKEGFKQGFIGVSWRTLNCVFLKVQSTIAGTVWGKACWENQPEGSSPQFLTILAYLCASVTRSISSMTSSSTVGYSGSFFPISCSIRWYNSTSYLRNNKTSLPMTLNAKPSCHVQVTERAREKKMWKKMCRFGEVVGWVTYLSIGASLCCVQWN